jgi:protein TonB
MPAASGAASAPAPAREPQVRRIEEKPPATAADLFEKPAEPVQNEPSAYVGSAPSFGYGGATQERESKGGSNKVIIGVAAALLVVVGGAYFGWSHFKGAGSGSQPVATSASVTGATTPTGVPSSPTTSTATTSAAVAQPDITLENSETPAESHKAPSLSVASSRPSAGSTKSANSASAPAKPVVAEKPPVEEAPETPALVVKGGKVPAAHPAAAATADAPAPSLIGMGAPTTTAMPNLGTDATVKPKLQTLSVSQGVSQGLLYKKVAPSYPSNALRMHIEGEVQLMATISKEGDITRIKVLSGDAQLAKSASDAVKQWKYKPYLLNGEPVEIQTQVTVNFKLPH